jgi:hypothetical protein
VGRLGFALLVMCLPLCAQRVYKVNTPHAGLGSRVEFEVGGRTAAVAPGDVISVTSGEWEVTVTFDAVHCEVACAYRRIRATSLLSPPVTTIRFYPERLSAAQQTTVDPAGISLPKSTTGRRGAAETDGIPERRMPTAELVQSAAVAPVATSSPRVTELSRSSANPLHGLSLRI